MSHLRLFAGAITVALLGTSCTTTYTRTRTDFRPNDAREMKQEKDGVVFEILDSKRFPPGLPSERATVQACDPQGRLLIDQNRAPIMEQVSVVSPPQIWDRVAITNQTDRVIRLNLVVIRMFDPAGNQLELLNRDEIIGMFLARRPCPSSNLAAAQFQSIKLLNRNMEIVPGSTVTAWIAFRFQSPLMPGMWKYGFYDVPIKIDDAGRVEKVARFEMRFVAKKFVDTYQKEPFAQPKLIGSKEIE